MRKLSTLSALLFALAVLFPYETAAQTLVKFGPRVSYDIDQVDAPVIGADVRVATPVLPVQINPYFDYYLQDEIGLAARTADATLLQAGLNALYSFGFANQVFTPYAGAGVGYTRIAFDSSFAGETSESGLGVNVVGGAEFGFGPVRPFVQAQFTLGGPDLGSDEAIEPVLLGGGVLFNLGGR